MARPRSATDEQILEGTVRAIGKHGPVKLTLAHVAAEVGITPAAIVQRFGSKHALLLAVGASSEKLLAEALGDALAADSPLTALREMLQEQVGPLRSAEEMANHMAFLQLDLADPDLRRRARRHARSLLNAIARLLEAAADCGELRPGDAQSRAMTVYTTYNGALTSWAFVGKGALTTWLRARLDDAFEPYLGVVPTDVADVSGPPMS